MPIAPLASTADLQTRGIDISDAPRVDAALASVSDAIRDAAGCPISRVTATVRVTPDQDRLTLLGPVVSVDGVTIDGVAVTDFYDDDYGLLRARCWGRPHQRVLVTYTFGYDPVPADIVDLACNLAKAHLDHLAGGGGSTAGITQIRLDDAAESYNAERANQISPVYLPQATRDWLSRRFGGGVTIVSTR